MVAASKLARRPIMAPADARQDLRDGIPRVIDEPYKLPRDPYTKKCVCMDEQGACTIYEKRPASCRVYDCRGDPRVWIDFEARIPAPMPPKIASVKRPDET